MSYRILIADDFEDSANAIGRVLQLAGYETFVEFDGVSALNRALEVHPHAAVIDLAIPRLDGFSLARSLRHEAALSRMGLVCLTGQQLHKGEERDLQTVFDHILIKPVGAERLIEVLDSITHELVH